MAAAPNTKVITSATTLAAATRAIVALHDRTEPRPLPAYVLSANAAGRYVRATPGTIRPPSELVSALFQVLPAANLSRSPTVAAKPIHFSSSLRSDALWVS